MKRIACLVLALFVTVPAWSAEKITVAELKQHLQSLHDTQKTDHDVAMKLSELELTESLSAENITSMQSFLPGKESRAWLNFLAAQSAILPPPVSEIPTSPIPDLATQKAILARCVDYVTNVYMHNPHLVATKTTTPYTFFIMETSRRDMNTIVYRLKPSATTSYTYNLSVDVESEDGIETAAPPTPNKMYGVVQSQTSTGPALSLVLQQAIEGGHLSWLRWQLIGGKPVGVFSFAVDKTKSQYQVNYCCFLRLNSIGGINDSVPYYDPRYEPFKKTVPFHGAFFIDPETGTVERLIMQAELSPTAPVHREDTRIDYASVKVADTSVRVPVETYKLTAVVPNANSPLGYRENRSVSEAAYTNYKLADKHP